VVERQEGVEELRMTPAGFTACTFSIACRRCGRVHQIVGGGSAARFLMRMADTSILLGGFDGNKILRRGEDRDQVRRVDEFIGRWASVVRGFGAGAAVLPARMSAWAFSPPSCSAISKTKPVECKDTGRPPYASPSARHDGPRLGVHVRNVMRAGLAMRGVKVSPLSIRFLRPSLPDDASISMR